MFGILMVLGKEGNGGKYKISIWYLLHRGDDCSPSWDSVAIEKIEAQD